MKKALVLLNMGGPNNLDEVEVFLKNMFNDKNIITVKSDLLRSFISFMIVTSRKKEARSNYAKLGGKSPIVGYTKQLIEKLQNEFKDTYVTFAMRYTPPFAKDAVEELKQKGITEVTILPLYPQYSTTTTKSSLEDFEEALESLHVKTLHVDRFYENRLYNELIIEKIEDKLVNKKAEDFELIFSAHSLPQKIVDNGDPYQKEILSHVEILKDILKEKNIVFKNIHVAYQSKLGPVKWLDPSLEDKLKSLTCKKVIISPLSFTIDNSETEFELSIEYKEVADELGFEEYLVAKCPNDSDKFVKAISQIVTDI
ncbi:ferrochelatase [Sulfurospirillum sp.]|nr:ferrochelatase [Sulfurospirillum sp.]